MPRIGVQFVVLLLLAGILAPRLGMAQSGAPASVQVSAVAAKPVSATIIHGVSILTDKQGPAVEILSNRPLIPKITKLEGPPRLVIDLPDASIALRRKRIAIRSADISAVRVDQYRNVPPMARVVVDLLRPVSYAWDAAGNRLMIRMHAIQETPAPVASVPAFTQGIQLANVSGVSAVPHTSGAVLLAGNRVAGGSSVTAGADTAIMHLAHGGEVRVCPGSTVSVTASQNGHDVMLGMSTGALEAHFTLNASADSVLTPDFRILLAGPGEFHYAVSADSRGNTCVRALPGNTASAIVYELMGDGTYQVKPTEHVVFRGGRLSLMDVNLPEDCGCPAPATPVLRASAPLAPPVPAATAQPREEANPVLPVTSVSGIQSSVTMPETAALPASKPNDVHIQVDAPFVFRASDPPPPPPAPTREAASLPLVAQARPEPFFEAVALPPVAASKPEHHGFFGKVRGFFAALFR